MPKPPPPPEKIVQLMRFIAEKSKNVTSPMNVAELSRQFKEVTGSSVLLTTLSSRIHKNRLKIHEMNEFDIETKVKMMFALSAPIDAGFIIEMEKIADVEVDDQQRITHYKQKDGTLELIANNLQLSMNQGEKLDRSILLFLVKKSETTDSTIPDEHFLREFKANTGCTESIYTLVYRYRRVKSTIFELPGIDKNTKIKMMFISNVQLSDDILEELREDADIDVDYKGRITRYIANDGSLKLEGYHSSSTRIRASKVVIKKWQAAIPKGRKRTREVSEKDVEESLKVEDDWSMNSDMNNSEVFDYDPPKYEEDLEHIPVEKKPESLMEVKTEEPHGPSTSNLEYHFEENFELFPIKPKPEIV